jgi:hypothetical protein
MYIVINIIIGALFLWILHIFLVRKKEENFEKTPKVLLQIQVSKNNEKSAKVAEYIFTALQTITCSSSYKNSFLGNNSPRISFEIASINQHIYFYIWCPEKHKTLIITQLYAQYGDIEIKEIPDYTLEITEEEINRSIGAEITTTDPHIYPIKRHPQFEDKTSQLFLDPLSAITSSLSSLESVDEKLSMQITISPLDGYWRQQGMKASEKIRGGFRLNSITYIQWYTNLFLQKKIRRLYNTLFIHPFLFIFGLSAKHNSSQGNTSSEVEESHQKETHEQAINGKLSHNGFDCNIRWLYTPTKNSNIHISENKLKEAVAGLYQFNMPRFNSFAIKNISTKGRMFFKRFKKRSILNPFILNTEELATLWHLPNNTVNTPNIQWVQSNKLEAPLNLPQKHNTENQDFNPLGSTNFRSQETLFGIKKDDRRRHMYIIGKTGMGKSTILENMIVSDINKGKGVAIIDPHGDLADSILNFIPKSRTNDVMIFNPSDSDFPVSFNMLECKIPEQRYLVASGLLGVFKKMFGESWGPRLEHILRNTILALTENPGTTILGIMRMLTDDKYRKQILKKVEDPMVKSFWRDEFGKWNDKQKAESVSPIQNKVGQFLSSPVIRNIFGQPKSSVDLRFLMDKEKIIIINLSKGKIGDDNSSLLGSMMITKFQLDAMSRADIAEKDRKDFYLYVDEFQNFATDSFAVILSEARKYKLNLTMANQYIDQMPDEVKAALFGNVGTLMTCQLGAEDAEIFSKQFSENVSANDIVNLPKYQCYIKLMIEGMPSNPFSANTLPPPLIHNEFADKEKIQTLSRERYAKKKDFVEAKIQEWMQ